MSRWAGALRGRLGFGGDYNPEQWPESVWPQDITLMREAGVTMVTVGVFAWALLEPAQGRYDFGWLDRVLDLLAGAGIGVDLATATASPPPWFSHAYPHTLLTDADGVRRAFGARQSYCPSAPEYRRAATGLARRLAERYADHPAVVMWHVNNEYGDHNWHCFCDVSTAAFRQWLQARYSDLDALNDAWGTAFWSQRYTAWEQIGAPRAVSYNSFANPGQQLDWWRFGSDELRDCFRAEAEAVRGAAPQPLTTNFMSFFKPVDYWTWAAELDVVSNDHYLRAEDPDNAQQLAMSADLMRGLAGGAPWLLMEHSTSAVNWQPRNLAKAPGEMRRNSMQHIARGADGALFFQWRASRAGAEKFHSALLPHAGTDSKVWGEVTRLGRDLAALAGVVGSRVEPAPVGLLWDWPSWWGAELDSHPSVDVRPLEEFRRWHDALWSRGIATDVVGGEAARRGGLAAYRLVVVAGQYLMDDAMAEALTDHVAGGGTVLVTYFSGVVDENDHVRLGGYPGALRDLLGVRIEEFFPLAAGGVAPLSEFGPGTIWSELGTTVPFDGPDGAEVMSGYTDGAVAGSPAVTRRRVDGGGCAWYVGTTLNTPGRRQLLDLLLPDAGVAPVLPDLPRGVEALRRRHDDGRSYLFVVNHTDAAVHLDVRGTDLLGGPSGPGTATVASGGVAVFTEA